MGVAFILPTFIRQLPPFGDTTYCYPQKEADSEIEPPYSKATGIQLGREKKENSFHRELYKNHVVPAKKKSDEREYHTEILHLADAAQKENIPRRSGKDNRSGALRRKRKKAWLARSEEQSSSESQF